MAQDNPGSHTIIRATHNHVGLIVPLFDAYRQFYNEPSDIDVCKQFLEAQIGFGDTVVYVALEDDDVPEENRALGFTILYPTFNSVLASPMWVLNDIYVAEHARRRGIAHELIEQGRILTVDTCARRLSLETGVDNTASHGLYESLGFVRNESFCTYVLDV